MDFSGDDRYNKIRGNPGYFQMSWLVLKFGNSLGCWEQGYMYIPITIARTA